MADSDKKKLLAVLDANWRAEMEGHSTYSALDTYSALAKREDGPQRRNALRGPVAAEKHDADLWAGRIVELGGQAPRYTGSH